METTTIVNYTGRGLECVAVVSNAYARRGISEQVPDGDVLCSFGALA